MGLGEKAFKILEDTFYSTENLEKLVEKLQTNVQNLVKKFDSPLQGKQLQLIAEMNEVLKT